MRRGLLCAAVAALGGLLLALGACTNSQPTRFYILAPLQGAGRPEAAAGAAKRPAIGLRPVKLPDYLNRPHIVTRTGPNSLHLAEFDRWAAPLQESFSRVLAENLGTAIPTDRVAVFPWGRGTPLDYEVAAEVTRFEGRLGGECTLVARWDVFRVGAKGPVSMGTSSFTEPAGKDYETLVSTKSRLVASLGREIGAAIRTLPRQ